MDFDASYPVGGESFIEVSRLFRDLRSVLINGKAPLFFEYDPDEDKVKATYGSGIHDYVIVDILGSEVTSAPNADEDTGPPNEAKIVGKITQTNLATALGVMTIAAQPDAPRNVGISIDNDSGGALDLYQGATTFRVVGTFLGAAQTEDIVLTSNAGNKSVANGKHRYISAAKFKSKSENLLDFPTIGGVDYLYIGSSNIKSFSGLSRFGDVKRWEAQYCLKLESESGLADLRNSLEWLHINQSKKFTPGEELFSLKKLRVLCLNVCGPLQDLEFLYNFPDLLDFRFVDSRHNLFSLDPMPYIFNSTGVPPFSFFSIIFKRGSDEIDFPFFIQWLLPILKKGWVFNCQSHMAF